VFSLFVSAVTLFFFSRDTFIVFMIVVEIGIQDTCHIIFRGFSVSVF
jgi:uncharacterized membrane protein